MERRFAHFRITDTSIVLECLKIGIITEASPQHIICYSSILSQLAQESIFVLWWQKIRILDFSISKSRESCCMVGGSIWMIDFTSVSPLELPQFDQPEGKIA